MLKRFTSLAVLVGAMTFAAVEKAQGQYYYPRRPAARAAGAAVRGTERAAGAAVRGTARAARAATSPYGPYGAYYGPRPYGYYGPGFYGPRPIGPRPYAGWATGRIWY